MVDVQVFLHVRWWYPFQPLCSYTYIYSTCTSLQIMFISVTLSRPLSQHNQSETVRPVTSPFCQHPTNKTKKACSHQGFVWHYSQPHSLNQSCYKCTVDLWVRQNCPVCASKQVVKIKASFYGEKIFK